MLLIISNSMDGTTDLLLPFLKERKQVFRLNVDIWSEYLISIDNDSFLIVDPTGRQISEAACTGLYMRKAYFLDENRHKPNGGDLESWCQHQIRAVVDSLYWICKNKCLVRLVERNADRRLPKILQMRVGQEFFKVPNWSITTSPGSSGLGREIVCKGLRSSFLGDYKTLFTTKTFLKDLDPGFPWFLQEYIDYDRDITVVFVSRRSFAFFRERRSGEIIDYRQVKGGQDTGWDLCVVPPDLECAINKYMDRLGLSFGRLDFVLKDNTYYFLEVNSNGQFAWLDPDNKSGLLDWVATCISV
jgi:hypothetical protein